MQQYYLFIILLTMRAVLLSITLIVIMGWLFLSTVGLLMDDAVDCLNIPLPDYIKMDVDGIEHLILKGGINTLKAAKGALIEINDKFIEQANDAAKHLENAGFTLKEKRHADYLDRIQSAAGHTYNQIWIK